LCALWIFGYKTGPLPFTTRATPTPYVKAVRKFYAAAFQTKNLKVAMGQMDAVIECLIDTIEERRETSPVDVQPLFVKMAVDVIGVVAFDMNLEDWMAQRIYVH